MHPILNIAFNAARQASDIILRNIDQVEHLKITSKGNEGYRSEVDIKVEQAIINTIHKAYPAHGILAEETGTQNDDADIVWIIDPIDGTHNFLHSFPYYAISIAVRVKNRIEHGLIYDPLRHECFLASHGQGARLNDRRIRVSKQTQLNSSLIGTGGVGLFENLYNQCLGLRHTGAVTLDLAYVASGRLDGMLGAKLQPWDIAAGSLLIREAGGFISDFQGNDDLSSGNIVAGPPKIFKFLLQQIGSQRSE